MSNSSTAWRKRGRGDSDAGPSRGTWAGERRTRVALSAGLDLGVTVTSMSDMSDSSEMPRVRSRTRGCARGEEGCEHCGWLCAALRGRQGSLTHTLDDWLRAAPLLWLVPTPCQAAWSGLTVRLGPGSPAGPCAPAEEDCWSIGDSCAPSLRLTESRPGSVKAIAPGVGSVAADGGGATGPPTDKRSAHSTALVALDRLKRAAREVRRRAKVLRPRTHAHACTRTRGLSTSL